MRNASTYMRCRVAVLVSTRKGCRNRQDTVILQVLTTEVQLTPRWLPVWLELEHGVTFLCSPSLVWTCFWRLCLQV
jgi:hypothetical protein